MKQKVIMMFSNLTCTREELSDVLEQAAIGIRDSHNMGMVYVGEKGYCQWRLYPIRHDEAYKARIENENNKAFERAIAGIHP